MFRLRHYVHATTAIDGNTLTLGECIVVLQARLATGGKTVQEHLEIINGARAFGEMLRYAKARRPVTPATLKDLHAALVGDALHVGTFRDRQIAIAGSTYRPPNPDPVPALVDEAFARFEASRRQSHTVAAGALLHLDLLSIHPFLEGNGRAARLLNDLHLVSSGFPPVLIDVVDTAAYFAAIKQAQAQPSGWSAGSAPFAEFMAVVQRRDRARHVRP